MNGLMENFDFTQFITFDSDMPRRRISAVVSELFQDGDFAIVDYDDMEGVKRDYYSDYWKAHSFELKNDGFLGSFMDWKVPDDIPEPVSRFIRAVNLLSESGVSGVSLILCSFAEKHNTGNEVVFTCRDKLHEELYKMSIHSFKCPDNLIINITDSK